MLCDRWKWGRVVRARELRLLPFDAHFHNILTLAIVMYLKYAIFAFLADLLKDIAPAFFII